MAIKIFIRGFIALVTFAYKNGVLVLLLEVFCILFFCIFTFKYEHLLADYSTGKRTEN